MFEAGSEYIGMALEAFGRRQGRDCKQPRAGPQPRQRQGEHSEAEVTGFDVRWGVEAGGGRGASEADGQTLRGGVLGCHQERHFTGEEEDAGVSQKIVEVLPSQRNIRRALRFPN